MLTGSLLDIRELIAASLMPVSPSDIHRQPEAGMTIRPGLPPWITLGYPHLATLLRLVWTALGSLLRIQLVIDPQAIRICLDRGHDSDGCVDEPLHGWRCTQPIEAELGQLRWLFIFVRGSRFRLATVVSKPL